MKVVNGRWSVNTRDFKHGKYCLDHCLHFATALAAGLDEAVEIAERFPNDPKNLLEMEKGNDYEELVFAQIRESLPAGDFDQIAEHSNRDDTRMALLNRTPVIAQAPLSKTFGNVDFNGRADLLVREDYKLIFTDTGTFAAVKESDGDSAANYTVWDIKHSEGKDKSSLFDYEMQVAMMAEGLNELGLLSKEGGGLVMRDGKIITLNVDDSMSQLSSYRAETLSFLESHSPQAEHQLASFDRFCSPKSKCNNAGCDFPDMCSHFREESDSSSFLRSDSASHFKKLADAGFSTITAIAGLNGDEAFGFDNEYLRRYVAQAKAVVKSRSTGNPEFVVIENAATCGAPIVAGGANDLYFDFEYIRPVNTSEAHYFLGGYVDAKGEYSSFASWSVGDENSSMTEMLNTMFDHLTLHPDALIYHYDSPEVTGIKTLGDRYGLSHMADLILSRMVDLQKTVLRCVATSKNGLGLKALASFFDTEGYGSGVSSGDDASLKFYEAQKMFAKGQTVEAEAQLEKIREYHQHDCDLTRVLHGWLIENTK